MGFNCDNASYGVSNGIRTTKNNGYNTSILILNFSILKKLKYNNIYTIY